MQRLEPQGLSRRRLAASGAAAPVICSGGSCADPKLLPETQRQQVVSDAAAAEAPYKLENRRSKPDSQRASIELSPRKESLV